MSAASRDRECEVRGPVSVRDVPIICRRPGCGRMQPVAVLVDGENTWLTSDQLEVVATTYNTAARELEVLRELEKVVRAHHHYPSSEHLYQERALLDRLDEIRGGLVEMSDNRPCERCGRSDGTFLERGFNRCKACGYPGQ